LGPVVGSCEDRMTNWIPHNVVNSRVAESLFASQERISSMGFRTYFGRQSTSPANGVFHFTRHTLHAHQTTYHVHVQTPGHQSRHCNDRSQHTPSGERQHGPCGKNQTANQTNLGMNIGLRNTATTVNPWFILQCCLYL
jgi:hypothetical protein